MLMPTIWGENLFDDLFDDVFDFPAVNDREMKKAQKKLYGHHAANIMKTDVRDHEDHYDIDMDLPGFAKEDINVELKDGYLMVTASKEHKEDEQKEGKYVRKERYSGSLSRSFFVGEDVKQEDIHAKYESGVLKLSVPKKEPEKPQVEEKKLISIEG